MQKEDSADIAAVAVIKSLLTPFKQIAYSSLTAQMGSSAVPLQMQVPPESATMLALTATMYLRSGV